MSFFVLPERFLESLKKAEQNTTWRRSSFKSRIMVDIVTSISSAKARILLARSSIIFFLKISDNFWRTETIKRSAVFFPTRHSLMVHVAFLHFTFYCFHCVQRSSNSFHVCCILIPDTNYHDSGYRFSIFRRLPLVYVS